MMGRIKRVFQQINSALGQVRSWIKAMPDTWAVPMTLVAFWISMYLIRWIDPTAGIFDVGLFQLILVLAALLTSVNFLIFLGIEFNFPIVWDWYKNSIIKDDWLKLTPWQRFIFFSQLYFGLLLFAAILTLALT